eukprot:COSAG06_NODE_13410_length_1259_cov_16.618966_1_plen_25_part_10
MSDSTAASVAELKATLMERVEGTEA